MSVLREIIAKLVRNHRREIAARKSSLKSSLTRHQLPSSPWKLSYDYRSTRTGVYACVRACVQMGVRARLSCPCGSCRARAHHQPAVPRGPRGGSPMRARHRPVRERRTPECAGPACMPRMHARRSSSPPRSSRTSCIVGGHVASLHHRATLHGCIVVALRSRPRSSHRYVVATASACT